MQVLWVTCPQPNYGQCYQFLCLSDSRQCETVKVSCPFTEPLAPVKSWTTETIWQSAKCTFKTELWLIQGKLPPEASIKDQSVSGWLVRKPYKACSVSSVCVWDLTEANVLVWPCPAPPVLHKSERFQRVRAAMRCLDYLKTPSAAQRKTLGLSVLDLLPLSIFYSMCRFVCVFMSSLAYIWCIGTGRQHPV